MKPDQLQVKYAMATLITLLLAFPGFPARAQDCIDSIASTVPLQQYLTYDNGTVEDTQHKIMWMQCSIGQTWQQGKCLGTPRHMSWEEALTTARAAQFADYSDWRLPTLHELNRITELRCQKPAINLMLFPDTLSADF